MLEFHQKIQYNWNYWRKNSMFKDALVICDALQEQNYTSPANKLAALKRDGVYYQIRHGRYETKRDTPPHILACSIYGPSYLSFEYALSVSHCIRPQLRERTAPSVSPIYSAHTPIRTFRARHTHTKRSSKQKTGADTLSPPQKRHYVTRSASKSPSAQ